MKDSTKSGIDDYVEYGLPPGDFLMAVLQNNLTGAIGQADAENLQDIFEIVSYCYNGIPSSCWGSPENVANWLNKKLAEREVAHD